MPRRNIAKFRNAKTPFLHVKALHPWQAREMSSFAFLSGNSFLRAPLLPASTPYAVAGIAFAKHGNPPVYLSLDIDSLDPAFVGMDCVEVAPPYDHAELTSYAAACLVWTYLCGRPAHPKS